MVDEAEERRRVALDRAAKSLARALVEVMEAAALPLHASVAPSLATPSPAIAEPRPEDALRLDPKGTRLLKVAETAKHLGVSTHWVYERINRGEIPVVELGDTIKNQRVRESDLAAFIERHTYGDKRRR